MKQFGIGIEHLENDHALLIFPALSLYLNLLKTITLEYISNNISREATCA